MITDISVTRGGDNNDWCPNGHPKTIKVDVTNVKCEKGKSKIVRVTGTYAKAYYSNFPHNYYLSDCSTASLIIATIRLVPISFE